MNKLPALNQLPFRRLKHISPPKQAHPAAQDHLRIGIQLLSQIGLVKPHHPDIAGLIANDSLGAPPAAQHYLLGLPHTGNDGLLFIRSKLRDGPLPAIVKVTTGKEVKQIPNCIHT